MKSHVTQWLHAISSFPPNLVHVFFETYRKLVIQSQAGSLKNETENNYYKAITKCHRSLLQSASGITK